MKPAPLSWHLSIQNTVNVLKVGGMGAGPIWLPYNFGGDINLRPCPLWTVCFLCVCKRSARAIPTL